jgi:aldose 1-epimerase
MEPLILSHGDQQVSVRPELGGAIAAYRWRDIDLLRPAPADGTVRQMGCFPLVPYANRIGGGRLPGHPALAPNFPPEPHSLHGFGWQRAWHISASSANAAILTLLHAADAHWPFDCDVTLDIRLDQHGLHQCLTLTQRGQGKMPAGLGFHPFFPTDSAPRLDASWDGMWDSGSDHLPRSHSAAAPAAGLAVAQWAVDNCFTGWNGRACLSYARHLVELTADCPFLHCFKPFDGRPFIALEPVSHMPNAHQLAPQQLRQLGSGQQFSISMQIQPHERPS